MSSNVTLWATIGLVLVFGLGLLAFGFGAGSKKQSRQAEVLASGIEATAQVIDMTDTGNRYNKNPEVRLTLEVQPTTGDPYQVVLRTVISVVELAKYQPGATVSVKYDPEDRSAVALVQ